MLRSHGVLQVDDLPEMIELLGVFSTACRPTGGRIGAVTESGAEAALLGDHAERNGLTFPARARIVQKPFDMENLLALVASDMASSRGKAVGRAHSPADG